MRAHTVKRPRRVECAPDAWGRRNRGTLVVVCGHRVNRTRSRTVCALHRELLCSNFRYFDPAVWAVCVDTSSVSQFILLYTHNP